MRKLSIALLIAIVIPAFCYFPLDIPGDDVLPLPEFGSVAESGSSPL